MYDVSQVRADFPILAREINGKPLSYLDNGASAQKPRAVIEAVTRAYGEEYANVHRGLHTLSNIATERYEAVRGTIARFLGAAREEEIVFTTGTTERLFEPGPDPISLTELLETGVDTYDFTTLEQTGSEMAKLNTVGRDEALGGTEVIDGVTLHTYRVQSETRDEDGNIVFAAEGKQYVLKEERLFMLGQESYFDGEQHWQEDNTPREFIFPGEPGFEDFEPRYGCNALQAGLTLPARH